jgi:peptidoglycan/xylan/chitin deacetylase (PgdA/CDA1 family)
MLLTLFAVLISIFLGFTIYSETNNVEKLKTGITDLQTIQEAFSSDITELTNNISAITAERDNIRSQVDSLKKNLKYKTQPVAFLTFDDGPSANTSKLLDILKQYNIKATFFIVGSRITEDRKAVLKRIAEEGHTIGIHSYSHTYETIYSGKEAFFEDLEKVRNLIIEITGVTPEVIRLPGGTAAAIDFCKQYGKSETLYREIMDELALRGYTVND